MMGTILYNGNNTKGSSLFSPEKGKLFHLSILVVIH
jgi:hypothetical protein